MAWNDDGLRLGVSLFEDCECHVTVRQLAVCNDSQRPCVIVERLQVAAVALGSVVCRLGLRSVGRRHRGSDDRSIAPIRVPWSGWRRTKHGVSSARHHASRLPVMPVRGTNCHGGCNGPRCRCQTLRTAASHARDP